MHVGQGAGSLGEPNPPFWFYAVIYEGFEPEHFYSGNLFTLLIEIPVSSLVHVGRVGVGGREGGCVSGRGGIKPFCAPRAYLRTI